MKKSSQPVSGVFVSQYERERPLDWHKEFNGAHPLYLEIGFGRGEFLLRNVLERTEAAHVGIELDWGRIRRCFRSIMRSGEKDRDLIFDRLRILHINAWDALERMFSQKTLASVECLFPCPWPKDCHERHRLFSRDFLKLVNSRLIGGGNIYFVTDYWPYKDWILEQINETGFAVREQAIGAQFGTKFERKWVSEGQQDFCELIFTKEKHIDIPVKEDIPLKAYYHQHFVPEKFCFEKDVRDGIAIVLKEWIYDRQQQKGMARLTVAEENLTQHIWIGVIKTEKGWCVLRSEGQQVLPTPGTARAIEIISEAVEQTAKDS